MRGRVTHPRRARPLRARADVRTGLRTGGPRLACPLVNAAVSLIGRVLPATVHVQGGDPVRASVGAAARHRAHGLGRDHRPDRADPHRELRRARRTRGARDAARPARVRRRGRAARLHAPASASSGSPSDGLPALPLRPLDRSASRRRGVPGGERGRGRGAHLERRRELPRPVRRQLGVRARPRRS